LPVYSLTELNTHISHTLQENYPEAVWVTAEVSSISINSYSGHCYLELSDGESQPAKAKAMIWKKTFDLLHRKFQIQTGTSIQKGQKIQILVKVEFNIQYGLSLIVWDIDSDFSLGEIARKKIEVLQKLEFEGVIHKNKQIPLPTFFKKIAVVSSENAAGFQDFVTHLVQNPYGYTYSIQLFPAQMQGKEASQTIPAAFKAIETNHGKFDLVVLIRGGGSSSDLQIFDSYEIAKAITEAGLPVFTGIGHERDDSVADQVANLKFKTPTSVADFLIEKSLEAETLVMALGQRIAQNLLGQLQTRIFEFQSLNQQIVNGLQKKYQFEVKAFQQCTLVLGNGFRKKISEAKEEFSLTEQMVMASNPIAILSKGYARVFQKKLIIHSAKEARADAELNLQFLDGMISAKVNAINNYDLPASN